MALAEGMLNMISEDHTRYVGCINFLSVQRLAKLQMKLRAGREFVATNQFYFSLMNHANMGLIAVWGPKEEEEEKRVRGGGGGVTEKTRDILLKFS